MVSWIRYRSSSACADGYLDSKQPEGAQPSTHQNSVLPSPPTPITSSQRLSALNTDGESFSDEEHPMALTSIALAATDYSNKGRLHAQECEPRNDWQPKDVAPKTSDNRSSVHGAHRNVSSSIISKMPSESLAVVNSLTTSINHKVPMRLTKRNIIEDSYQSEGMRLERHHRRELSFLLGDDSETGPSKRLVNRSEVFANRPSKCREESNEAEGRHGVPVEALLESRKDMALTSASGPESQFKKAISHLNGEEKTTNLPRREGSSKSVLTAIKECPSRSSSYSHQGSFGSNEGSVSPKEEQRSQLDRNFAIAAARAAKKMTRQAGDRGE